MSTSCRQAFLILLCSLASMMISAQDALTPNASFEKYSYCPSNFNQGTLEIVTDWRQASKGTSDYFNACSTVMGVPDNSFGSQLAKDGEGYIGLIAFAPAKRDYREYMQAKLSRPLSAGEQYCVSFYVSLAEKSEYIVDGMGVTFTKTLLKNPGQKYIPRGTQITNPRGHVLSSTDEWMLLSDVFTAEGGERYVTLGNFLPDAEMVIKQRNVPPQESQGWSYCYYYVDMFTITPVTEAVDCNSTIPALAEEMKDTLRWQLPRGRTVTLDNVLFDFDEDLLDVAARSQLDEVVSWMRQNEFLYLEIMGHTDVIGREGYNLDLSQRRADRVLKYIRERGIPSRRLTITYYGSAKPVADNTDSEGRQQNRRVDFMVLEKEYDDYRR